MVDFEPQPISNSEITNDKSIVAYHTHDGINTPLIKTPLSTFFLRKVQKGITAATGSTQATGVRITSDIVEISVCANAGDAVTLPSAVGGMMIIITNHGVASCDVFPNVGDSINEAAVNTAKALAANATGLLYTYDSNNWEFTTLSR